MKNTDMKASKLYLLIQWEEALKNPSIPQYSVLLSKKIGFIYFLKESPRKIVANKIWEEVEINLIIDIFNERPSKDDQQAVTIQNQTELPTHGILQRYFSHYSNQYGRHSPAIISSRVPENS